MFGMGIQELLVLGIVGFIVFMVTGYKASEAGGKIGAGIKSLRENIKQIKNDVSLTDSTKDDDKSKSLNTMDEIKQNLGDIPKLDELKRISKTVSNVRRFTRFLG